MTPQRAWTLVGNLIAVLGVTEAPGGGIYRYPVDGKGGVGFTLFQPITESFIVVDAWPDLGGSYVMICSCKDFNPTHAREQIEIAGFRIAQDFVRTLAIGVPPGTACRLAESPGSGTGD